MNIDQVLYLIYKENQEKVDLKAREFSFEDNGTWFNQDISLTKTRRLVENRNNFYVDIDDEIYDQIVNYIKNGKRNSSEEVYLNDGYNWMRFYNSHTLMMRALQISIDGRIYRMQLDK